MELKKGVIAKIDLQKILNRKKCWCIFSSEIKIYVLATTNQKVLKSSKDPIWIIPQVEEFCNSQ